MIYYFNNQLKSMSTNPSGTLTTHPGQSGAQVGIGFVDLMMNQMIMEQLKSINSTGGFTVSTIVTLILIMSLTELKSSAGEFIKLLVTKIKEYIPYFMTTIYENIKFALNFMFTNVWGCFTKFKFFIKVSTKQTYAEKETRPQKENSFTYLINWSPKIQQVILFLDQIINDPDCSYEKENECSVSCDSYTIKYKKMKLRKADWIMNIQDIKIEFKNSAIHAYESIQNLQEFSFGSKENPKCLCDLMTEDNSYIRNLKSYIKMGYLELQKVEYIDDKYYIIPFIKEKILKNFFDPEIFVTAYGHQWEYDVTFNYEAVITFLLKNKYKSIDVNIVLFEIYLIMKGHLPSNDSIFHIKVISHNEIILSSSKLQITLDKYDKYDVKKLQLDKYCNHTIPALSVYMSELKDKREKILSLSITSPKEISYEKVFLDFLQGICDRYEKSKDPNKKEKVSVFELKLKRDYKEITKDNPKYTEYMDSLNSICSKFPDDQNSAGSKDDGNESKKRNAFPTKHSGKDVLIYRLGDIPSKTITSKDEVVTVEQKAINTVYKGLDTLYLREQDKAYLQAIINRFNSCSDIYTDLDIPHKLGVLLHGEPGTGKSSTIKAIASYTKRDIYYVDLSNVKKNSELKMIFDHVNKGCIRGGILVFEDIDCMTDIVRPRKKPSETFEYDTIDTPTENNILSVMKEESETLNLSYFLNLLDGTLSVDNLLFVITTNHIENLDSALIRNGRIDVNIELRSCDRYQIASIYNKITKKNLAPEILEKIPEYKYKPIDIITHILKYYVSNKSEDQMMDTFYM